MHLASLVPHFAGLCLRQIIVEQDWLTFVVIPTRRTAPCPICHRKSARIHSRYERVLIDLPWADRPIRLRLDVRRFRCVNRTCSRQIFAERFPKLAGVHARRTQAQRSALADLGFELGGSAGARIGKKRGLVGSRATILRVVHAAPTPDVETPRVLGVDDWARKRGQTYGTILVDLERQRPVDLLEDRTADSFAAWLKEHPGVEVIARDRGGAYADGARQGAPAAVQVADRFHLLLNIGEVLERVLGRKRAVLKAAAKAVDQALAPPTTPETAVSAATTVAAPPLSRPPTRDDQEKRDRRNQRRERYDVVIALHQAGLNPTRIAREVGIGRKTVRRFLRAGTFPERAEAPRRPSILDPFDRYLRERWTEGCHNSLQLWREIQAGGFVGAASLVRRYVARWRLEPGKSGPPPRLTRPGDGAPPPPAPMRSLSPRQARWLLLRPADPRSPDEQIYREYLLQTDSEIPLAHRLADEFGHLVRERRCGALNVWLNRAEESGLTEFRDFALVMRRDQAAVEAALTYDWSNGQTEGQITRLKFLKRQMFGRASFRLLKKRVLRAA